MNLNVQLLHVLLFGVLLVSNNVFGQSEVAPLEVGKPIEREMKGGETHNYRIRLAAGQFLHVAVDQRKIDLAITMYAPDGFVIFQVVTPNSTNSESPLWCLAQIAGDYKIVVRSRDRISPSGNYQIRVEERQPQTPDEKNFIQGKIALNSGLLIQNERQPGSVAKAVEKFDEAGGFFRLINDTKQKALALSNLAYAFHRLREFEKAIANGKEAITFFEKAGMKNDEAVELVGLGNAYTWIYSNDEAFDSYKRALSVSEAIGDKVDQSWEHAKIGELHRQLGDYESALKSDDRALKLAEETGDQRSILNALNGLGLVYTELGNYVRALEFLEKHKLLVDEWGIKGSEISILINIGRVYSAQGNMDQAMEYFQKALAGFKAGGAGNGESVALGNIGNVYSSRGQYAEAIDHYNQAIELRERLKLPLTVNLLSIGHAYKLQGKYEEALQYLGKALESALKRGEISLKAAATRELAEVYLLRGDLNKAAEFGSKALSLGQKHGYTSIHGQSLIINAKVNLRRGKTKEATNELLAAIEIIENIRRSAGQVGETGFLVIEPFQLMVGVSVGEGKPSDAFSYSERIKARTLLDLLKNTHQDTNKLLSMSEREHERRFRNELVSLNTQISRENGNPQPDKNRVTVLQNRLEKKRLEFEDFQTRLYVSHPELRVQRGEMKPISLEESGRLLADTKSALLEYVVADDKAFLFVVTKDAAAKVSLKVFPIAVKQKDLAERVEKYRSKVAAGDLDFQKQSRELYDLLLKPAQAELKGKSNLIVVPDGPLWDLPFQALQPSPNKYLVENAAISYAPSLTALREMTKKAKKIGTNTNLELLAFGNPTINKETSERVQRVFMGEKLDPIPEAERLVNSLGKLYGANRSKVYTGSEAREETAKTESPKFRIVQFATHGILNNASPMYSHLVLSQKADNPNEDGLLEAWEMKDLDLKADMVVLSACDTARGRVSSGEGMIGMNWALFIAGTPTTVASQWKVESSSTTEFMLEFHRQMVSNKKITKAEALRRASLKLLKSSKYRHPSYWAPWILVGDGS